MRILIIDDEDDVREVAQLSLEMMAGHSVTAARSGAEGVELAVRERPDAILLDVMMPGMDGPAAFRELRGDPATRDIPVVLLTGRGHAAQRDALAALGVDGVIAKPFDPMTLAADLAAILDRRRQGGGGEG